MIMELTLVLLVAASITASGLGGFGKDSTVPESRCRTR
jgi:hypothetical protein